MKAQYFVLALVAVVTAVVSAAPAWSYRWGGYNSFGSGYGYSGLNALRFILPVGGYRGNNYNYGNGYNYNRGYNYNIGHHHHHHRWW